MAQSAVPFPLVRGKYHIDLFYFPSSSFWAICQKKGRKWVYFCPEQNELWNKEFALTHGDPLKLLQLFAVALGSLGKKYELASFIRNRLEAYEKFLVTFLQKEELTPVEKLDSVKEEENPIEETQEKEEFL